MANKPYDPVNSIEGMFNGCITRIAQAIKDPVNFGPSTKGVLQECSKRFQDALDDCEIQLLEAKFYLEHQLAQNKARREAKLREETAASTKRKHDEIKDAEEKEENAKRIKIDDETTKVEPEKAVDLPKPAQKDVSKKPEPQPEQKPPPQPAPKPKEPESSSNAPIKIPEKPPEEIPLQTPVDEFPKATPNATPAPTNDEFNFESMFGEPSADAYHGDNDNDITFDLDLGADFTTDGPGLGNLDTTNPNSSEQDLNSLLPGLESYAHQMPDEQTGGIGGGDQSTGAGLGQAMNNFDLPNLQPNEFDALLDAHDFGAGGGDMNFTDDNMMNPESMDNLDFDSMFS